MMSSGSNTPADAADPSDAAAAATEDLTWRKRHQKQIWAGAGLLAVGAAVAIGVSLGTKSDSTVGSGQSLRPLTEGEQSAAEEISTPVLDSANPNAVEEKEEEISSLVGGDATENKVEVANKDEKDEGEEEGEVDDTAEKPEGGEGKHPSTTHSSSYCFQDKAELQIAIYEYIQQGCTNNPGCAAGRTFGWPMNSWCVSRVTDMSFLFSNKDNFNEDLSDWDVSSVTSMYEMFSECPFNQDISKWDVSKVTDMAWMFFDNKAFNQDISSWDVSSVTDMYEMLNGATSFNQDLCAWGEGNDNAFTRIFSSFLGDTFPYDSAENIFVGSGCTFQGDPQEFQQGSFCASDCSA